MKFLALCATAAAAVKLNEPENFLQMKATTKRYVPRDEGFSRPWDKSMEDDDGELDIHNLEDMSDEVDTNHYRGEDEKREQINEQVTHWKQNGKHPVIVRSKTSVHYSNDDLW